MTPKRIKYLKQYCHDRSISLKTARECGKMIPSLQDVEQLYRVMEEIMEGLQNVE